MRKLVRKSVASAIVLAALAFTTPKAEAVVLAAPIDNVPVPPGVFFGGVELDSIYHLTASGLGEWEGTLASAVYRAPGGTLDFYYQISNTLVAGKDDKLVRSAHINFTDFITDVYYILTPGSLIGCGACPGGTFADGTQAPALADRNVESTVGFDFGPDADRLDPGEFSVVYVIRTNATAYMQGGSSVSNGGTDNVFTFQPAVAIAEPASIALLGLGLFASAYTARRRRAGRA